MLGRLLPLLAATVAALAMAAPASADNYVALGDSYSSGQGTGYSTYNLNVSCRRSTYGYPYLLKNARANTSLNFVACSGATTQTIKDSQISALNSTTNFSTVTAGGNDIGFGNLIISCLTFGCNSAIDTANNKINNELPAKLDSLYSSMKARAPQARHIVLGYPRVFGTSGCFSTTGIDSTERSKLNTLANNLNSKISAAVTRAGFTWKDANTTFNGHQVCSSEWINGSNIFHPEESFHPNRLGNSSGYLPLVRQVVG